MISFWLMDGVRIPMVNAGYYLSWFVYAWLLSYLGTALIGATGVPAIVPLAYHEVCSVFMYSVVSARRLG